MAKIVYLTLEQILLLHEDQIDRYGGSSGVRDFALLESALYRSHASFGGEDLYVSVFDKAAATIHSLILNHPFIDGNKRTGMVTGIVFLELNGFSLQVEQKEIVEAALRIYSKEWDIEKIALWLKNNSTKIPE